MVTKAIVLFALGACFFAVLGWYLFISVYQEWKNAEKEADRYFQKWLHWKDRAEAAEDALNNDGDEWKRLLD